VTDHGDALLAFGLEHAQLEGVARLAIGGIKTEDGSARRRGCDMENTVSRRWADLVDEWTNYAKPADRRETTLFTAGIANNSPQRIPPKGPT
jgi:hypothetical protein